MIDETTSLGSHAVRITAPGIGELDRERWAEFAGRRTFGFDVETTAIEKRGRGTFYPGFAIRTAQFAAHGADGVEVFVLRMDDLEQKLAARSLLACESNGFIAHTAFDAIAVHRHFDGLDVAERVLDTRILARLAQLKEVKAEGIRPVSHGLKGLVAEHLGAELPDADAALKEEFARLGALAGLTKPADITAHGWNTIDVGHEIFAMYAGLDAAAELLLSPLLIRAAGQPEHVLAAEQRIAAWCARQTVRGFRLDIPRVDETEARLRASLDPLEARHLELSGFRITQTAATLLPWLEQRGFDAARAPKTETGNVSLGKDALPEILTDTEQVLTADARELLELRRDAAEAQADLRTIAQWRAAMDERGHIHPTIQSIGTATGRVATSSPNVQNVAPRLRGCIIPDDGWTFAAIDLDQVELRFAHAEANEVAAIQTVIDGGDLHTLTAERTGVSRKVAKTMNFQLLYGSGATGIAKKAGISLNASKVAVAAFWRGYPRLSRLKERLERGRGRITLVSGRKVPAPFGRSGKTGPIEPKDFARLNYFIQGSCRDLLMGAWLRLEDDFGYGQYVALSIHDEWLISAPSELIEDVMQAAKECLSFTFKHAMPINADPDLLLDFERTSRWMKGEDATMYAADREQFDRDLARLQALWDTQTAPFPDPESAYAPIF